MTRIDIASTTQSVRVKVQMILTLTPSHGILKLWHKIEIRPWRIIGLISGSDQRASNRGYFCCLIGAGVCCAAKGSWRYRQGPLMNARLVSAAQRFAT